MRFFYNYFGAENHTSDQDEMFVKCPFPHKSPDGEAYLENRPSAHINTEKEVFHCKVCGESHSEPSFMAKIKGITYGQAIRLLGKMNEGGEWKQEHENLKQSESTLKLVNDLGLTDVVDSLKLGYNGNGIAFPIFVYDELLGYCNYNPNNKKTKAVLSSGAINAVFPFDLWVEDERPTLLCAGFKDAAIARAKGFNAVTFTHGENSLPKLFKHSFKQQHTYIVYDNDHAGKQGAVKAATFIKENGGFPHIVDLSAVCTEKGEDIHDFFMKYGKSAGDLQSLLDISEPFTEEEYEKERNQTYPLVKMQEATQGKYSNRVVSSRVSVVANFEEIYHVPEAVEFYKFSSSDTCTMDTYEKRHWYLDEYNLRDILYLCDSSLKEEQIDQHLKRLAGIPKSEKFISVRKQSKRNVFKAVVMDDVETEIVTELSDAAYKPTEMTIYSLDQSLNAGEKSRIFYKPVAHPLQSQKVVGIATKIEESDNAITSFKITNNVLDSLKCFQGDVRTKMKEQVERVKAIAGAETLPQIALTVDLFYHTPLQFKFGNRLERGYLEPMLVGESRTGKSQTAKKLLELYELGVFTSLKTATTAGLIGGSDQTSGGWKTKLGIIPRNHKSAVIMEEFSGADVGMISKLTDIRSSNMVRLTRVNGTLVAPALVRMLSISNQRKTSSGQSIPLRQYPHGVKVVLELIGAAEDIARYDFFVLVDKPKHYTDPNTEVDLEPYPKESYLNRVRWVWSRKPEQIVLDKNVREYIVQCAKKLNEQYDSHINFFGAEAWKKLARLSVATAACVCSMDETGEKLVVKQEHVEWAKNFLVSCYDNDVFRLKQYVTNQRKYTECPPASVQALQGIYNNHSTLVHQMEMQTEMGQNQLRNMSGLDHTEFSKVLSRLAECYFIQWDGDKIVPTERFRKALSQINSSQYMTKVGAEY